MALSSPSNSAAVEDVHLCRRNERVTLAVGDADEVEVVDLSVYIAVHSAKVLGI